MGRILTVPRMIAGMLLTCSLMGVGASVALASQDGEETAKQHLAAFLQRDMDGDGFNRLGPFLEPTSGDKSGCGCSSSGNHFDIADDPILVADRWKILGEGARSGDRISISVWFHVMGDSRMTRQPFAQGLFRHLTSHAHGRGLVRTYLLEHQFDGSWAVLADQTPVVSAEALALVMAQVSQRVEGDGGRAAYYRAESLMAKRILQRTHKVLADLSPGRYGQSGIENVFHFQSSSNYLPTVSAGQDAGP